MAAVSRGGMTSIRMARGLSLDEVIALVLVEREDISYRTGHMLTWKVYALLIAFALMLGSGVGLGYALFHPRAEERRVTTQSILTAMRSQGFLVTQTYVFDQPVTITKSVSGPVAEFLWGETITARGAMEVNMGIDLSGLRASDIVIEKEKIRIVVPAVKMFDVRLIGPLDLQNERGLLKRLVDRDRGYNEALNELVDAAEKAATAPELLARTAEAAQTELIRLMGYVAPSQKIEVTFKEGMD